MMKKGNDKSSAGSVLFAVALLLAALTFAEVASFLAEPARAHNVAARASALSKPDAAAVKPYLEETKKTAEALKEQNLFVKKPPKEHPVKQVDGILGNEILVANKWYKVGDKIGDAKIISIKSTEVMIEWDGKTKSFAPMAASNSRHSEPPKKPEVAPAKGPAPLKPTVKAEVVEVVEAMPAEDEDPFGWMGVRIPDRIRTMLLEKWNSLTDEQKEEAK